MRQQSWWSKLAWIGCIVATCLGAVSVEGQESHVIENGQRIYSAYCEFCHGEKGQGDGPMVEHLLVKPTDLTQIQKKNTDQFPFWQVYQMIDGQNAQEETIKGHGRGAMPIWGQVFERQKDAADPLVQEEIIIGRLLSLVHFLESIQDK